MIIATTYENGDIYGHFGHTKEFKLYQIEGNTVISSKVIETLGSGHGALAQFLKINNVDILICGGIGMGARVALSEAGIKLLPGVTGNADMAVDDYLHLRLNYNPDATCNHHHEDGHNCGEHDCSDQECGGHCK